MQKNHILSSIQAASLGSRCDVLATDAKTAAEFEVNSDIYRVFVFGIVNGSQPQVLLVVDIPPNMPLEQSFVEL